MDRVLEQAQSEQFTKIRNPRPDLSALSPSQIREGVQWLVAKVQESLIIHPDSEDVLAIGALVAVVRQDWQEAVELFKILYFVQGDRTAALTYQLYIRSLRCNFQLDDALDIAKNGLCRFPENIDIVEDCADLAEQLRDWKTAVIALGILIELKGPHDIEDLRIRSKICEELLVKEENNLAK